MRENFLHYIWKYKKIDLRRLFTTNKELVRIVSVGEHNHNSGPDFFNAQLYIDEQLWAGNVEIHLKSSDWYLHHHEQDKNYDNVILHVVWQHDSEIFRKDNTSIPTLELQNNINKKALQNYQKLFSKQQKWINCENDIKGVHDFIINNWLERLYFERLERKYLEVEDLLKASKNNWEAVLFKMLAKNFGLKVNSDAFLSIANSFDFKILQKTQPKLLSLEALFFGQAELLQTNVEDAYYKELQREYLYLKQKFSLTNSSVVPLQFFRLRPTNFPTIRLSQLAILYHQQSNLFSKIIKVKTVDELYVIFNVAASAYWETHYTFNKASKYSKKQITKSFVDLLIINTIMPLQFSYIKHQGKPIEDFSWALIQQIASEKNNIVAKYNQLGLVSKTALNSQALLQLKTEYCNKNKCLQCAIGNTLLNS